uniref:Uncharacterized protein n=1 Tax=Sphaerodactylus townsendi TaxID=933632 RepID=A0ACB8FU18_9SAUR
MQQPSAGFNLQSPPSLAPKQSVAFGPDVLGIEHSVFGIQVFCLQFVQNFSLLIEQTKVQRINDCKSYILFPRLLWCSCSTSEKP